MVQTTPSTRPMSGWVGWIYFASTLMLIVGGLQIVAGLMALFREGFYITSGGGLVIWDYDTWGWVHLGIGALLIVTAIAVLSGRTWARVLASLIVVINAIGNIAFLPTYPLWSIVALVIDGLVLYALTVHGRELRTSY